MRPTILMAVLFLIACNNSTSKKESEKTDTTHTSTSTDTTKNSNPSSKTAIVNDLVRELSDNMWHVVTDAESGWTPDVFDYFVKPKRATDPDYPYVATGDFNCDNRPDYAALVTDSAHKKTYIVFITDTDPRLTVWGEEVSDAAISSLSDPEVAGFKDEKEKKVKLNCTGLEAVWFESASYVIYWNGRKFDHVYTSD